MIHETRVYTCLHDGIAVSLSAGLSTTVSLCLCLICRPRYSAPLLAELESDRIN